MSSNKGGRLVRDKQRPTVIIAGAGLAGLACAKRLVDGGYQVVLLEAAPQPGGRTSNWIDPLDGQKIESGIHTFWGIYSHLIALLNEVGVSVDKMVHWDNKVGFLQPDARLSLFGIDPLRDLPQALGGLIGNNGLLGPFDKVTVGLTFLNGLLRRDSYGTRTVAELAKDGGLDRATLDRVVRPIVRGITFMEPEDLSAKVLITLLQHGLTNPWNLRAGSFKGGMTDLMVKPLADWLENHGAIIRTGAFVKAIRYKEGKEGAAGRVDGFQLESGEIIKGDVYVCALPLEAVQALVPAPLRKLPYFASLLKMETVPAISVQLWYDCDFIKRNEFIFLSNSPLVLFQDQSRTTFPHEGSRISAQVTSRYTGDFDDHQLINMTIKELQTYLPESVKANVVKSVVVRHRAPAIKPATRDKRPLQGTPLPNLVLAGDHTRQDWYTTMEGATISGERAAAVVLHRMGHNIPIWMKGDYGYSYLLKSLMPLPSFISRSLSERGRKAG